MRLAIDLRRQRANIEDTLRKKRNDIRSLNGQIVAASDELMKKKELIDKEILDLSDQVNKLSERITEAEG